MNNPREPCANFRDVGRTANQLARRELLREGVLFRSGKLDFVTDARAIESPRTVLNLRPQRDRLPFEAKSVHVPFPDGRQRGDRYDFDDPRVRAWLRDALAAIAAPANETPLLVHCLSGKDRTGVVIGATLVALDVPAEMVVKEYVKSAGDLQTARFKKLVEALRTRPLLRGGAMETLRAKFHPLRPSK